MAGREHKDEFQELENQGNGEFVGLMHEDET